MTFEISGWQADWQPAREQLVRHTDRFRGLGGKQVKRGWVAWIEEHEERFPDLPVIVEFEDGVRLEVCWQKFDDLSITWNSIDVTVPPMAWVTWPLSWRLAGHPALTKVAGAVVTQVNATEHLFTTRTVCPEESAGTEPAVWLCGGLWLGSDQGGLHIFNALDESALSTDPPSDGRNLRQLSI